MKQPGLSSRLQRPQPTPPAATSNTSDNDSYNTSGNGCYSDYEESPQNDTLARAEDAFSQWQRVDDGSGNESGNISQELDDGSGNESGNSSQELDDGSGNESGTDDDASPNHESPNLLVLPTTQSARSSNLQPYQLEYQDNVQTPAPSTFHPICSLLFHPHTAHGS